LINVIESNIIGQSPSITQVKTLIQINAQYPAPVLITGETGTGKELAARGLHYSGIFSGKPFIAINCSTFSDDLFASELFGYKKGAFTDAKTDKEGLLIAANGGSIFLDEIDSLSIKSQTSLLRLLQESEFRPVGSSQIIKAHVRIIAAANCNLAKRIKAGEFRQDLYFRLFILTVRMPALRERKEDLELLISHFIHKFNHEYGLERTGICAKLLDKLQQYDWPGNVRELENTIHRHYLLSSGPMISEIAEISISQQIVEAPEPNPQAIDPIEQDKPLVELVTATRAAESQSQVSEQALTLEAIDVDADDDTDTAEPVFDFCEAKRRAVEAFEARFVSQLLHHAKGNVTKAANLCGKERRAFGKLIKKYHINRDDLRIN
jgi:DNA-binding NtrC family response regulator